MCLINVVMDCLSHVVSCVVVSVYVTVCVCVVVSIYTVNHKKCEILFLTKT